MKILIIATGLPIPTDHGRRLRMYHLYKSLPKKHQVHWVCFDESLSNEAFDQSKKLFHKVYIHKKNYQKYIWDKILQRYWPYAKEKEFEECIRKIHFENKFDLVIIDSESMAAYVDNFSNNIPKILNTHNIPHLIETRSFKAAKSLTKKIKFFLRYFIVKEFERKYFSKFDVITFVSEKEVGFFKNKWRNQKIFCIPNGVDSSKLSQIKHEKGKKEKLLVFIGPLDYHPNFDAVYYFCKNIFPIILKHDPEIQLKLIGKGSDQFGIKYFPTLPIISLGFVDHPYDQIVSSKLLIAPFRIGGGTRIKILEAIALGIPIISTSIGAEGIESKDTCGLFRCDNPDLFASKVVEIIQKPDEELDKLCMEGKKYVMDKYNWNNSSLELENLIQIIEYNK